MNLLSLASHQLRRAADLVDEIEKMKKELSAVLASSPVTTMTLKRKRRMSAAGRLAIAAAQKARWAKTKVKLAARRIAKKPAKRTMSAAGRAKIAAAAKARWAKAKAAGKKTL
jgi:hypothetical protein